MKVYEGIRRLFKVYEGIWKYMEVYKVYPDILKNPPPPSLPVSPTLFDFIRSYSILFCLILLYFALFCNNLPYFALFLLFV